MKAHLTVSQTAQRWEMDPRTIRKWCEAAVFPAAFKVGNRWLIPLRSVELREGTQSVLDPTA